MEYETKIFVILKKLETDYFYVRKNIQKVIDIIWKTDKNQEIISSIFDINYPYHKPYNIEFLLSLYSHIESHEYSDKIYSMN